MRLWEMVVAGVVAVVLAIPAPLLAQQPPVPMVLSPGELEQLAAPIALYSDALVAQVLMAATYPLEVVQAARFVRANPTLKDGPLYEALRAQNWDDSVKALAPFPQILDMLDDQLDWTQRLGYAFLVQRDDLMAAVQSLRARAQAQGTLISSPQQIVRVQAPVIYIEPASPQVIYVPVYNPLIVYGPWPYPAHQPYYYRPVGWSVGRGFYAFGSGIFIGFGLWGTCDWHRHAVFVDVARYRRFTEVVNVEGRRGEIERRTIGPREGNRLAWQHDVRHRESVEYRRTPAQQHVATPRPTVVPSREPFRGRVEQPRVEQRQAGESRAEQPRAEQGRPQPGRGGQEAIRPSVQPAPRPESSRPNLGDSPRVQARVQASLAPAPVPRRDPGEGGHENRASVAPSSPAVRSAPVPTVTIGSVHEATSPSALSGGVQGGGARR